LNSGPTEGGHAPPKSSRIKVIRFDPTCRPCGPGKAGAARAGAREKHVTGGRVDRLERARRRWALINAALLVGTAVLGAGGVHRTPALEAQQVERRDGTRTDTEPQAEARVKVALKALESIRQRVNAGVGVMYRDHIVAQWSRRLLHAQLDAAAGATPPAALFEAHRARMREVEARADCQYRERRISDLERMELEYFTLEAELWSARVKAGRPPGLVWRWY
jgi:hypothetical protein